MAPDGDEANKGHSAKARRSLSRYVGVFIVAILIGIFISPAVTEFLVNISSRFQARYLDWRFHVVANEFRSIAEGFESCPTEPFVVRNCRDFDHLPLELVLREIKAHPEWVVFGNNAAIVQEQDLPLLDLLRDFQNDNLSYTIFESPLAMFDLPQTLKAHHFAHDFELSDPSYVPLSQTPVLTPTDYLSSFHIDPLYLGGGWMFLWQGVKEWSFHESWMAPLYYTTDRDSWPPHLRDPLNASDFFQLSEQHRQQGDFSDYDAAIRSSKSKSNGTNSTKLPTTFRPTPYKTATVRAGDFVYFPPGWLHRVHTPEKALGLGGYIRPRETLGLVSFTERYFDALGINGSWNSRENFGDFPPSEGEGEVSAYAASYASANATDASTDASTDANTGASSYASTEADAADGAPDVEAAAERT